MVTARQTSYIPRVKVYYEVRFLQPEFEWSSLAGYTRILRGEMWVGLCGNMSPFTLAPWREDERESH